LPLLVQLPAGRIGIAEARETLAGLETQEARRLPGLDATKEGLKRQIEPPQGLLQGVAAEFDKLRPGRLDLRQDVLLIVDLPALRYASMRSWSAALYNSQCNRTHAVSRSASRALGYSLKVALRKSMMLY